MGAHHNQPIQDNPNFVFDGKLKIFTLSLTALGAICLLITYFTGAEHDYIRFWTNLLQNTVFFTGIAFASLFFIATHTVAWGGWQTIFKRVPEAMMMFMPVGLILLLLIIVGVMINATGTNFLYLWSDEHALETDKLVIHKSAFLNPTNYLLTLAVIGLWTLFAWTIRRLSIQQDGDRSLRQVNYEKIHMWSAIFLPIAGFSSAYAIWQWVMSVDTHWYSTLFAWYATVSVWVSAICIIFLIVLFLKTRGHMQFFTKEHMHDLGKYVFGFSVFWTYLWFSQFLLIWYANNGEETQYFYIRFQQFPAVFYLNILINFIIPFFALMMNSSKRAVGTLGFIAGLVVVGHWLDYYQMIKPGVWYNYEHHKLHADHGDDHKNEEHKDDAQGEKHGSNDTYRLEDHNKAPKAVLTGYQEDQHEGDDHNAEDHTNEAPEADTTAVEGDGHEGEDHAEGDHDHDAHEGDHDHGDDHAHATAGHDGHEDGHDGHEEGHDDHGAHAHEFVMGIHFPGLLELGTMIGFLGLFLFVTFTFLSQASLMPKNDPYVDESKHHHVWYDL
jgi:hypothetical protein